MVVLELAVDARGVRTGLTEADQALDQTGKKAQETTARVGQMGTQAQVAGNNMSAAFAATGGGIAVTRGLVGISDGFRNANISMAGFSASQALLDLGRFGTDMRAVGDATGATGGAFSRLGAIIKANPLMTIAGVIAAATTAMGLFGGETEATADEFEKLGEAMRKARLTEQTKAFLGGGTGAAAGRMSAIEGGIQGLFQRGAGELRFGQLLEMSGLDDPAELRRLLGAAYPQRLMGGGTSSEFGAFGGEEQFPTRQISTWIARRGRFDPRLRGAPQGGRMAEAQTMAGEVARDVLRTIYLQLQQQAQTQAAAAATGPMPFGEGALGGGPTFGPGTNAPYWLSRPGEPRGGSGSAYGQTPEMYWAQRRAEAAAQGQRDRALQFGQGPLGTMPFGVSFAPTPSGASGDMVSQSPEQREAMVLEMRRRANEEAQRAMDELIAKGEQFGATIGDAFFNVASGATTARQAIAAIVADLARAQAQKAFSGMFGAFAASFGQTPEQSGANETK